jgi:hypothetical protein
MKDEVEGLLAELKHSADDFATYADSTYRGQTQGLDEVHCALQWAQNSTTLFLGVKYAARWSAPGAIEVSDVRVNISTCCFELEGFGHHSNIRKRYTVKLDVFADLLPAQSSWLAASVGRLTATLQKAQAAKWPRLTKMKAKTKHQVGTWLDMKEKWDNELSKRFDPQKEDKKTPRTSPAATASKAKSKTAKASLQKGLQRRWKKVQKWAGKHRREALGLVALAMLLPPMLLLLLRHLCSASRGKQVAPATASSAPGRVDGAAPVLRSADADPAPSCGRQAADAAEARARAEPSEERAAYE